MGKEEISMQLQHHRNLNAYQRFNRIRNLVRAISSVLLTGYVVYIILNISQLQVWHWISIGVFALMLIFTGRGFCGYLCPVGSLLDFIHFICKKAHIKEVKRSERFNRFIRGFRYFFCVFYFVLHFGIGIDPGWALVVLLVITTPIMVRFWCSICPVGIILGLFSRISIFRLKKNADICVGCSLCAKNCPMQNEQIADVTKNGTLHDVSCMFCGKCIEKCPKKGSLELEIARKKIIES